MSQPTMEVADILRAQGNQFLERYQSSFSYQRLKAFRAILRCRTAALGGHIDVCHGCGYKTGISYNSCRSRSCPKCQAQARERWLQARQRELLDTGYFHVVFTVPHELNPLAHNSPALFYDLLFAASSQALLEVAADPKRLGAEIGFLSILHSWGSNLLLHPHAHCVVPAGGLSPDHQRWIHTHPRFLLPIPVLRRVFRDKFLFGLKHLYSNGSLDCSGPAAAFQDRELFSVLLNQLRKKKWIVYAKPPFGGPAQVLRYLGRYTHRIAISNHRLLAFDGERVSFRWKDYVHGGKQRIMTLDATEFLRRFFLHVLPKGFVRIRHFGLLSNRFRSHSLLRGPKAAGARWPRSIATTYANNSSQYPSALALSQMRRSHVCRAKTHCRRGISIESSRFLMTSNSNPHQRLASCTPMLSCLQHTTCGHATAFSLHLECSIRENFTSTDQLPSPSLPIHAPRSTSPDPEIVFKIHNRCVTNRARSACAFLLVP